MGITCHHVLKGFRERRLHGPAVFQFGPIRVDPELHLISESSGLDLATVDFTAYLDASYNGVPRAICVEPFRWPPAEVDREDVLALAGFPGVWRDQVDINHLRFYSFSSGATPVESSGDKHLVTRIKIEECVVDLRDGLVLGSLGGLSGGPVFAWRKTPI